MSLRIAFITSCTEPWGGSEELWTRAAAWLQEAGVQIAFFRQHLNMRHPQVARLLAGGAYVYAITPHSPSRLDHARSLWRTGVPATAPCHPDEPGYRKAIAEFEPQLVVVSQGMNFDGLHYGYWADVHRIPYVLVSQKAVAFHWPGKDRADLARVHRRALRSFFVSQANRELTEEQFGERFPNARVVWNPSTVAVAASNYPDANGPVRLACIGRYYLLDKGQDLLVRVLARQRWRSRPLFIDCYGAGMDREALEQMAALLGVETIGFHAHTNDVFDVLARSHALVLPSRAEGMALVMLEAMACARPVIATRVGGAPELIEDGVSGFLCDPTENSIDDCLERAWQQRAHWEAMGKAARHRYLACVPADPVADFGRELLHLAQGRPSI
jgi:glycosyltransferase involved in cell wall biosynthesis